MAILGLNILNLLSNSQFSSSSFKIIKSIVLSNVFGFSIKPFVKKVN